MATSTPIATLNAPSTTQAHAGQSLSRRALRRFFRHRMAVLGLALLLLVIGFIVVGSFVYTEADANFNDTSKSLNPPSAEHPFGTDTIGRDILARAVYGGQISLVIGVFSMVVSLTVGVTVGLLTGYFRGWLDVLLMRFTEAMLSIPTLLLLLVMAKAFGGRIQPIELFGRTFSGSIVVIILIIGLTSWMALARIIRGNVLALRETEYVQSARALGAGNFRIITQHIFPNTLAPIIVSATLGVAGAILQEAYISFLGLGVQSPTATWGNMLDGSRQYFATAPWLWLVPGVLILITVMGINFVGDGLRDALDPRSEHRA